MSREKAAAEAIFNIRDDAYDLDEWIELDSVEKEPFECQARAALAAADAVMLSDAGVGRVKHALYEHRAGGMECYDHVPTLDWPIWCCPCGEHIIIESWREHMARAILTAATTP